MSGARKESGNRRTKSAPAKHGGYSVSPDRDENRRCLKS